jgi:hypothetical protein
MVAKSKAKSKRRPPTKPKRSESKPLLRSAEVRTAKPPPTARYVVSPVPLVGNLCDIRRWGAWRAVPNCLGALPGAVADGRWLGGAIYTARV